jgi:hypothetical protein
MPATSIGRASTVLVALALVAPAAASGGTWAQRTVETDSDLHDVEATAEGLYAVGGSGVVAERTVQDGEVVYATILQGGASGDGNDLYGSDVTDDGERLWFVGASGEVGEYDVVADSLDDHSGPDDTGDNFNDVAVTGEAGQADVYAATDSGLIFYSFENGAAGTWNYVTPGSGASMQAIDCHAERACHAVDTNGKVFATDDGETWDAIGIPDANVNFYGVDSDAPDDVWVAGGNGMVFHYDGAEWTPTDLGDADLQDVEVEDGVGYAVGAGGAVFHFDGDGHRDTTETEENLNALALAEPDAAVGASGTAIER